MQASHAVDPTPFWKRRRYFVVMMAFCGLFNVYALRVNLSVAIVAMTDNRTVEHDDGTVTYEQYFDWSSTQKGYILSSFFYGYLMTQVIGGVIAAKIGGNLVSLVMNSNDRKLIFFQAFRNRCRCYGRVDFGDSPRRQFQRCCIDCSACRRRSF